MVLPTDDNYTTRCAVCGELNPPDAHACQACSAPLSAASADSEPASSTPDWLPAAAPAAPPDEPTRVPGWLAPGDPPRPGRVFGGASEDDLPAWLANPRPGDESGPVDDEPAAGTGPITGETPDWLDELGERGDAPPSEAVQVEAGEVPAWLDELSVPDAPQPPSAEPVEDQDEDAPDWIKQLGGYGATSERTETERDLPGEPPDWISGLESPAAGKEPEGEDLDWLEAAFEEDEGVAEPTAEDVVGGTPDWLAGLNIESQPEPREAEQAEPRTTRQPEQGDAPEWLQAAFAGDDEPPAEPSTGEETAETPDWLTGPEVETETDETEPSGEPETSLPEWLSDTGPLTAPIEEEAEVEQPQDPRELPDWLSDTGGLSPARPEPVGDEDDVGLGWLDELNEAEDAAVEGRTVQPGEADAGNLDDWWGSFDFDEELDLPGGGAPPEVQGEDLLGLSGDLLGEAEDEATEPETEPEASATASAAGVEEMPEWLRGMQAEETAAEPEFGPVSAPSEDQLKRMQGLRYEAITGAEPEDQPPGTETVGALKDVSGVIQPELIFEGSRLSVEEPVGEIIVTEEQVAQINLVKRLLAEETQPPVQEKRARALPVLRWVVGLLLIAAVAISPLGVLPGAGLPAPTGSPNVETAFAALDALTAERSAVLVTFEYEPDTAGELEPLAEAMLAHLAGGAETTVYAISTRPTGPAMAQDVLTGEALRGRLTDAGGSWVNLGYLPGRANGINSLVRGVPLGVPSPFELDATGQPSGAEVTGLLGGEVDLIIVVAAQPEDLRLWVEQAGALTGTPLLAAVSARTGPVAQPYAASGQLLAVLTGIEDAAAYHARLGGSPLAGDLLTRRGAQATAAGLAAGMIVFGGLYYGLVARRQGGNVTR